MSVNLKSYMQDGANPQAKAVLAFLQYYIGEDRNVMVARWENCREQGYVVSLNSYNYRRQLNIAFFEHRNSDAIHAVKWEQKTINTPNIDTAEFGDDVYTHKGDTSKSVGYGEVSEMAQWINNELEKFYVETKREKEKKKSKSLEEMSCPKCGYETTTEESIV